MCPLVPYEPELDDPKYDNDPLAKSLKTMFQVANVIGFDNANISTKGVNVQNLTNPYKASAYKTGGNQTITHMEVTKITLATELFDPNNNFTNSEYTVPVTGFYLTTGYAYIHSDSFWGAYLSVAIDGSGNTAAGGQSFYGYPSIWSVTEEMNVSGIVYLTAGQKITLKTTVDNRGGTIVCAEAVLSIHLLSL
jgi:hypothetical protein